MTRSQDTSGLAASLTAMLAAAVLMAHQVGAKAARDAIFLSHYSATDLPAMVAAAAGAAILLGLGTSHILSRHAPSRIVPWAFVLSAALQLGEWRLLSANPHVAAVLIYLHFVALTAVLLSGFWSVTNETIDPHTAKRRFGQIAAAGTAGGLTGGLIVASLGTGSVLLWLAGLHIVGAGVIAVMRSLSKTAPRQQARPAPPEERASARQAFSRAPYLFSLAALVLVGTSSAAAIDWVFKAQSAATFPDRQQLMHFFGLYHSAIQVLGLFVQTFAARFFLERIGLGKTVATLPATVTAGSLSAMFFPAFPVIVGLRASEAVVRGSLFRSGYELFYTPVPVSEKRPAKSILDVGVDRLGDALGAGITKMFLWLGVAAAPDRILLTVAALSGFGVWIARRLDRGYVQALERGLVDRAEELELPLETDSAGRLAVLQESGEAPMIPSPAAVHRPVAGEPALPSSTAAPGTEQRPAGRPLEPLVQRMADLRSGRPGRVHEALLLSDPLDPLLTAQVINLLAWDQVSDTAREVLTNCAPRICGQLVDSLLDQSRDFAIRRRIPRVLSACTDRRAVDGLTAGLADGRFEVRFQAARALATVLRGNPELKPDSAAIFAAVDRELSVSRSVWEGHRLLDRRDSSEEMQFLDEVLRERANASLEHVFRLLALVLPREPLTVAFRALHTDAPQLRGLALEYLETVLPESIHEKLRRIAEHEPAEQKRTGEEVVASLMESNESVVMMLRQRLAREPE